MGNPYPNTSGSSALKINQAKYHVWFQHNDADGYITLAKKNPKTGQFIQHHYRPEELADNLSNWMGEDVFFSQNTFYRPQRRIENIRQLRSLYIDLDFYLFNYDKNWILGKLEHEFYKQSIPEPNLIIFSGQGVILIWLLNPVPMQALPLWQAVQNYLLKELKDLGGDPKACDAARIFRIDGSTSSKNGAEVHVSYRHEYRYNLRDIQYEYLPEITVAEKQTKPKPGRKKQVVQLFNLYTLNHARLLDLTKLVELRDYAVTGYREVILFLYRYFGCCFTADPSEALQQTLSLNDSFTEPLPPYEVIRATKSAQKAWEAKSNKEANEIAIQKGYPGAGYNISNKKLISWLDITADEMQAMRTIIDGKEKNRRKRIANLKMRREQGMLPRSEFLAQKAAQADATKERVQAVAAANPGASRQQIADLAGVAVRTVNAHGVTSSKKDVKLDILKNAIEENPTASIRQLVELTGISRSTVQRLKAQLEA